MLLSLWPFVFINTRTALLAERRLLFSNQRYGLLFQKTSVSVLIFNRGGKAVIVGSRVAKLSEDAKYLAKFAPSREISSLPLDPQEKGMLTDPCSSCTSILKRW